VGTILRARGEENIYMGIHGETTPWTCACVSRYVSITAPDVRFERGGRVEEEDIVLCSGVDG
jgi:hypothetical protein